MNNTLFVIALSAGSFVTVLLGALIAVKAFRKVPKADEALVKTGGNAPIVSTGGGIWVVPMFHELARVSLQAIRVPIDRTGPDAVPSLDMIPAEIKGEMFVQINPQDEKAIVLAVQSLGTSDPDEMGDLVRQKIDSQVTDALRTAAFQKSFLELNSEKKQFAEAVVELMQDDLGKLGLTLTAVSVTHVTQGPFTDDAGDVIAAQGRRNVAETVERNRQETNLITREAEITVQKQDVGAREQALALEFTRKQKEADQARQVEEYEATQRAETAKAVLLQAQSEEEARAAKERAVAEARAIESEKTEKAQIGQTEQVAIRRAEALAAQKTADEAAAIRVAEAEAGRKVAEEEAARRKEEAEIAKAKAVEAARIAKEQAIKVADEERQKAVETAEVDRQQAVALKRAEEAAARATQADAEAKQRAAEERVITVKETAEAGRRKEIVVIKAEEEAQKDKINADKVAYVAVKGAEGERDAAIRAAEALEASAKGEAEAMRARAEGYALEKTIRAKADFDAAQHEAQAVLQLAEAKLADGKAGAESRRLEVEAENAVAKELLIRDVATKALEVAPAVVREFMSPVAKVAHDVKVLQVNGLGGEGGESQSVPGTILGTGLALSGGLPILRQMVEATLGNEEVAAIATQIKGAVNSALTTQTPPAEAETAPKPGSTSETSAT